MNEDYRLEDWNGLWDVSNDGKPKDGLKHEYIEKVIDTGSVAFL